jgi:TonB family protein
VPRAQFTPLFRAGVLSFVAHGAMLLVFGFGLRPTAVAPVPQQDAERAASGSPAPAEASLAWVDLASPESAPPALPEPTPAAGAVVGDQTRSVAEATSPRRGTTSAPGVAATDSGDGEGRAPVEAFRRDLSTLRTRLSDGAHEYQAEHERTGARATSPQPIRQEPVVGVGDSSRTRQPAAAEEAPRMEVPAPAAGANDTDLRLAAEDASGANSADRARGEGPLDAEKGLRRFDVEAEGAARDDHFARAASDESHPGRIELSAPAATGADRTGRGPGETPGAVSAASAGSAPAVTGAEQELPRGTELAMSTTEREYNRTQAEIRRRVASALRFPKRLALMLEQGETVVHFVVRADGRLAGTVQIVKSAGFDEFDAAAVSAVNHAAPFPAPGRALSVSMPIAFDNPLVR